MSALDLLHDCRVSKEEQSAGRHWPRGHVLDLRGKGRVVDGGRGESKMEIDLRPGCSEHAGAKKAKLAK